jgi:lysophospholipase L1-like esterase
MSTQSARNHPRRRPHRALRAAVVTTGALCLGLAVLPAAAAAAAPAAAPAGAVASWTAGEVQGQSVYGCPAGDGGLNDQTVRNIVYPSVGGDEVRIRLSNVFGTSDLTVAATSVALEVSGAQVQPGSRHTVLFGGHRAVTIPPGSEAVSDWVDMDVAAQRDLAVSLYVPAFDGPATEHPTALQNNFLSKTGDWSAASDASGYPTSLPCWMFLDGVDVRPSANVVGSVVGFGDSITDGNGSSVNANDRWPNLLGDRLAQRSGKTLSSVDEGIGGNQLLQDAGLDGVSALARFDRDALGQPGVRDVIVLEGVNDIGTSDIGTRPHLSAQDLITAYKQLIAHAHAAGVRIYGATLTPFKGSFYWSQDGERTREQVNHWIRTSGAFDGVVDFSAAVADPGHPQVYNPAYDSGDHLHPNDAGYHAMVDTINLPMLVQGATGPQPTGLGEMGEN